MSKENQVVIETFQFNRNIYGNSKNYCTPFIIDNLICNA